tara:strand:+ start:66 stop:1850 length:1785 start_codon:yes stop_codon:yes gene_type:complete
MNFIKTILLLIVIPVFGYGVGYYVMGQYDLVLAESAPPLFKYGMSQICLPSILNTPEVIAGIPGLQAFCDDNVTPVLLLQKASVISGGVAILLLLSFIIFASIAGESRRKISTIFPPLVFASLFVLSALTIVQGAILTFAVYLVMAQAVGIVYYGLIVLMVLLTVLTCLVLIISSFKMASKQTHSALGLSLKRVDYPQLFSFVSSLANKLGARSPDHIVVGLEPSFYVTSANVKVLGNAKVLTGETLFISLPLSRILTTEEFTGVIGHELGHFRGDDTFYSMKFTPVYSGLDHAINAMDPDEEEEDFNITSLPALTMLSYMRDVFHTNVSAISREREFEADRAGAEVADGRALATSLLKISLYAHSWFKIQLDIIDRLKEGKVTRNMSLLFSNIVKYDVNKEKIPEVLASIGKEAISHPTDSHPATSIRIKKLGLDIDTIDVEKLLLPKKSAIEIIDGHREIEEQLTILQQNYYSAMGIQIPDEEQGPTGAKVISAFGAHMVLADNSVEPEEIEQAETIGLTLTDSFDIIGFREFCHHPEDIPELALLIDIAKEYEDEVKSIIFDYISKISDADGDICEEEKAMLSRVKLGLGI